MLLVALYVDAQETIVNLRSRCLTLIFDVTAISCVAAQAQNCSAWSNVKKWQGSYTVNGSGTFTNVSGKAIVYTINQGAAASVSLDIPITGTCPGTLQWADVDMNYVGSVNDTFTFSCAPLQGAFTDMSPEASNRRVAIRPAVRYKPGNRTPPSFRLIRSNTVCKVMWV